MQPAVGTKIPPKKKGLPGRVSKQTTSSSSIIPSGSLTPAAVQLKVESTLLQYSKCPISLEKPTFKACAVQKTRVASLDVEYMGWKLYGCSEHVAAVGW